MQIPNFAKLRAEGRHGSFAEGIHPDPRFYKYWWWVFWRESPVDGRDFLTDRYRLNTAAATQLIDELRSQNEPYWLYNQKIPRLDPTNPFDPQSTKWKEIEWAPSFDDDSDPTVEIEGTIYK